MNGFIQSGPIRIASRRMVCQKIALLMSDAEDHRHRVRMPRDEMNAAYKERRPGIGLIDDAMPPRQKNPVIRLK